MKMDSTDWTLYLVVVLILTLKVTSAEMQVATGKPTTQSSTLHPFYAGRAVDGDTGAGNMRGCSHTAHGRQSAWWRVDLQQLYIIKRILIIPRPTNISETQGRLAGFSVAVSEYEDSGYQTCFDYGKDGPLPSVVIPHTANCVPPVQGRYVRISNNRNNGQYASWYSPNAYVILCEVKVYVEDCHDNCIDCVCSACKDGFYGDKCNNSCSIHCGGNGLCNKADGTCYSQSCKSGYYGEHCNMTCSSHCVGNSCNFSTGYCDRCNGSFFGIKCNDSCPLNCASCKSASECNECKNGSYGSICENSCINCGTEVCGKEDGKCVNEYCKAGYFTPYCVQNCSENCKGNGSCEFLSGVCNTCSDGFYGVECELECVSGCKLCSNSTGCGVCSDGLYGEVCERTCPPCGDDGSCNIYSGLCHSNSCRPGFYGNGNKCDKNCSATCGSDRSCDVINGTCLNGCKPGFSGESCEENCSENCVACDQMSRNCTGYGCYVGYHGSFCLSKCSENCGGNGECSITEGTCASGCNAGWEGSLCLSQVSAKAESGTTATIGAAVGGIIVLASCVIIIIIIVRRRKGKNKQSESKAYMSVPDKSPIKNTEGCLYANVQLTEKMDEDKFTDTNVDNGVSANDVVLKMDADENTYYNTAQNILGIKIEEIKEYVLTKKKGNEFAGEFAVR